MKNALYFYVISVLLISCNQKKPEKKNNSPVINSTSTLYSGGDIITMEDTPGSTIESVVTSNKKVVFTGSLAEAKKKYPNSKEYDLKGNTMMPGLIEQHLHPFLGALTLSIPVIAPEDWELPNKTWTAAKNHDEYLQKLKEIESQMEGAPDKSLFTWGYHQYFHGKLSRKEIDKISSTRPIAIWHRSCHEFYLNSAMIKKLKIDQSGIDTAGAEVKKQCNIDKGHFYENGALIYLLPKIIPYLGNSERFEIGLKQMVEMLHNNGVTAYCEPGAFIQPTDIEMYKRILGDDNTPMYSFFVPETKMPLFLKGKEKVLEEVEKTTNIFPKEGKIRFFDKQIKILADGAIISQLMKMKGGYIDGHHGEWIQGPEEIEIITKIFWDEGYQIHIHVNGDEGLEEVLKVIEKRMAENPRKDHRTTIVHFANSTEEQIKTLAELGCIVSANPYYVTGFSDKYAEIGLGHERADAMVRLGSVEKLGVPISLHSDLPMGPSDPLYLAWCAATRKTNDGNTPRPDLALSLHQALRAITIDAAQSWQMEDQLGSIKVGKIANFTILEDNPYKFDADHLKDIKVKATVFEGKEYPVK